MGIHRFGAPAETILFLQRAMELDTFVEGGTYTGQSAKFAASAFQRVYTIEKSPDMHAVASRNLAGLQRVHLLQGDTREHLRVLAGDGRILYWLDAHWSGGLTYGLGDECPLLEELRIIFAAGKECAILVDDARLFLAPPPRPHQVAQWPGMVEIVGSLPEGWEIFVREDVMYLLPASTIGGFRDFLQELATRDLAARPASRGWWHRLRPPFRARGAR